MNGSDLSFERVARALSPRYRLQGELGSGGSAVVYVAEDLKHHRRVAVKVLRPELSVVIGAERFLREIELTANLQHPHVLPLYDSGEADGLLYYVMPWVDGESLRERIARQGALELDEAISIARAVASALHYAHGRGVVHRDVKPENVMLQGGEAVVADFGIALALADATAGDRLTATGLSVGTPGYMSPEQASGDHDVDERTDVYALGALLYEMLTGTPPFAGGTARSVLARVLTEEPASVRELRPAVPGPVDAAVARALEKDPANRFATAEAFGRALGGGADGGGRTPRFSRPGMVATIGALAAALLVTGVLWTVRDRRETRARREAVPEVQRLLGESRIAPAFRLALEARRHLPDDPTLEALLDASSVRVDFGSDPPGARVSYRAYSLEDTAWTEVGRTPVEDVLVPDRQLVLRFEHDGYRPHVTSFTNATGKRAFVRLEPVDGDDMVWIPAGSYGFGGDPVPVDSFRMDRTEVTNADFQDFVDGGAYRDTALWMAAFGEGAAELEMDRVGAELRDATGRPGPAGWELSRHPEGEGRYPVRGVSWFEAAAYCAWAGKSLPTFYHWKQAAGMDAWDNLLEASRFGGDGPVPAGVTGAVGHYGTVDMAGNVREWVWNGAREGRYILGGAWSSPTYLYGDYEAVDPWTRGPTDGFRCARYPEPPPATMLADIEEPYFDFNDVVPVDDETFAVYEEFYRYDPLPLEAQEAVVDSTADWIRTRVEFAAAYPGERVPAHVFLPRNTAPPWQTVVYFPGAAAFDLASSRNLSEMSKLTFLPRSGRALVYPVFKGTYERRLDAPLTPSRARQLTIWMTQDVMRTVDWVVERDDLDQDRLAYMGLSFGAELAVPVALEKRFDALVLVGAALDPGWVGRWPAEAAPWNFVSRITTPTALINGKADVMHPWEEGQVPFFEAIDVPPEDKVFHVSEVGHIPPWNTVVRHTLDWLDQRLGPVDVRPPGR